MVVAVEPSGGTTALPTTAPSGSTDETGPVHAVQPDETLQTIAEDYGIPLEAVAELNPQFTASGVAPGDLVLLPAGAMDPDDAPATAEEVLAGLEDMPRVQFSDIPRHLPPDTRSQLFESAVRGENNRRIALAKAGIEVPQEEDFAHLPRGQRDAAYTRALKSYETASEDLLAVIDQATRDNLRIDPEFRLLTAEAQELAQHGLSSMDPRKFEYEPLALLARSPALNQLDADLQVRFLRLMLTDNAQLGQTLVGEAEVEGVQLLFHDSVLLAFAREVGLIAPEADPVMDPQVLIDFMDNNPTTQLLPLGVPIPDPLPYSISEPSSIEVSPFDFDIARYEIQVGDDVVTVTMPTNPPGELNLPNVEELAWGLARLPPESRGLIKHINLTEQPDSEGATMRVLPDGRVTAFPIGTRASKEEVWETLIHETGHLVDWDNRLGLFESLQWSAAAKLDLIDPNQIDRGDPLQDFAEAYSLYMRVRGTEQEAEVRALMPHRFALLDQLVEAS